MFFYFLYMYILILQQTIMSIVIITIGCFIASAGDLEFDNVAYMAGLTSVFAQGGYLTLVQMAAITEANLNNETSQVKL